MPRIFNKIKLGLLLTGTEVMTGDILDSNSSFIAKEFLGVGLRIQVKVAVPDEKGQISQEIINLTQSLDLLIVNGGLGATLDDVTAAAAADACGVELAAHPIAVAHIEQRTGIKKEVAQSLQFKQALMPVGAEPIDNPVGTALGFYLLLHGCHCYFTPGVPLEMKAMVTGPIMRQVMEDFALKKPVEILRFFVLGLGESRIQQIIQGQVPAETLERIFLGFRVEAPMVEAKLTCFEQEDLSLLHETAAVVQSLLSDYIVSKADPLPARVNQLLRAQGQSLALAESCTGGLIGSYITSVAGASDVLEAGFVTYSYQSKTKLLGVPADLLADSGAVCKEVVLAMAQGALTQSSAHWALAVSGIAGPGGGTPEKPIGTVFIAWGNKEKIITRKLWIRRERTQFQHYTAMAALDLLRRQLQGLPTDKPYYFDSLTNHLLSMG